MLTLSSGDAINGSGKKPDPASEHPDLAEEYRIIALTEKYMSHPPELMPRSLDIEMKDEEANHQEPRFEPEQLDS